eukprot:5426373-Prymnesium_polylepis.1
MFVVPKVDGAEVPPLYSPWGTALVVGDKAGALEREGWLRSECLRLLVCPHRGAGSEPGDAS